MKNNTPDIDNVKIRKLLNKIRDNGYKPYYYNQSTVKLKQPSFNCSDAPKIAEAERDYIRQKIVRKASPDEVEYIQRYYPHRY